MGFVWPRLSSGKGGSRMSNCGFCMAETLVRERREYSRQGKEGVG